MSLDDPGWPSIINRSESRVARLPPPNQSTDPGEAGEVKVHGQTKRLYYWPASCCGGAVGVGLNFEGEGGWVIPIEEMRRLVAEHDAVVSKPPVARTYE